MYYSVSNFIFCAVCIALLSVYPVVETENYGIVSCLAVDGNGTHFWNIVFSWKKLDGGQTQIHSLTCCVIPMSK